MHEIWLTLKFENGNRYIDVHSVFERQSHIMLYEVLKYAIKLKVLKSSMRKR